MLLCLILAGYFISLKLLYIIVFREHSWRVVTGWFLETKISDRDCDARTLWRRLRNAICHLFQNFLWKFNGSNANKKRWKRTWKGNYFKASDSAWCKIRATDKISKSMFAFLSILTHTFCPLSLLTSSSASMLAERQNSNKKMHL